MDDSTSEQNLYLKTGATCGPTPLNPDQDALQVPNTALPQITATRQTASETGPLPIMDQLVSGPRLLEVLWDASSRPSLRWLRTQTKRRTIPFQRSAGRVWFIPRDVAAALTRPAMKLGRPAVRNDKPHGT
jgi:hypothetical protein